MDRNFCCFTVLFQPPFWVGIAERWEESGYSAAKVTFGPEPTDAQLYQWIQKEWYRLKFSPAAEGERPATERKNPKRAQREARAATQARGIGTRAQEALSRQREQDGQQRPRQSVKVQLQQIKEGQSHKPVIRKSRKGPQR